MKIADCLPERCGPARAALASTVVMTVSAGFGATAANAQSTSGAALEEIMVTAQRRSESLMDVPIPITAISSEAMEKQQIVGIDNVLTQIPNVSFVSQGSRDRKEISLRGISNQLDPYREGRQLTYAFYVDEFNVAVGTSNPEILDLERIEVLRGPQGTYFGRNSVGGAINVTTKAPTNDWFAEVGAGVGSHDSRRMHGIFNMPVIDGKLAVRASGQYRETDGWIENINPIGGGNDGEFRAGRVSLRYTPTERITWDLNYSYMKGVEGMRVGVPTGFLTATWRSVYYGGQPGFIANPDGVGFYPANEDKVNFNRPQQVGTTFDYLSTRFAYEFDGMTLTAIAGTLDNFLYNKGDVDGGSIDAFYEDRLINRDSTSGELRLQSTGDRLFDWSVGAFTGSDSGLLDARTYHGAQSPLGANGVEVTGAAADTDTDYWALFAQTTWNISDQWKLILGGRYSEEEVETVGQTRSNSVVTGSNARSASFDDFSPRLTLSYALPDLGLVYATASKGFKSGGVQTTGTAQLRNEFEPEELWNYELGWKTELLDRRVRLDVSAFYMDWKDVQQYIRFQFIDGAGLLRSATGIDNAASASTQGVEFSVDAAVTDALQIGAQVGYLDAKYGNYPTALIDGAVVNASGKPLVNAPEWTVGTYAEYRWPVMAESEAFVRAEWNYRSEQLTSTLALRYENWPFIAPSYDVTHLRAGIGGDKWSANAYVENVFGDDFFNSTYEQAFYSGVQIEPSTRTFGIDFRYRFGADGR